MRLVVLRIDYIELPSFLTFYTSNMPTIADLRKSYELAELDERASDADPLKQFDLWFLQALEAQLPEPNAMTLATVGANARPSTRVVLIKGYDPRGIVWYTNYKSRKGCELAANPFAALQFHWVELERVVRIEGSVEKVSEELLHPPPRLAHRRLGLAAKRSHRVARVAGGECRQIRRALSAEPAAATALGRISPRARSMGVLAGAPVAPARPAALSARRHAVGSRTARALMVLSRA